jgi:hypothetical protein
MPHSTSQAENGSFVIHSATPLHGLCRLHDTRPVVFTTVQHLSCSEQSTVPMVLDGFKKRQVAPSQQRSTPSHWFP